MKTIYKALLFLIFFLFTNSGFSQTLVKDDIRIELNPVQSKSIALRIFINNTIYSFLSHDFYSITDSINCIDRKSIVKMNNYITLNSGTTWKLECPPRKPFLFVIRLMFKSKNLKVFNRFNYVEFLGTWEARNELPYEMIEKFTVNRDIISGDGQKCVSIEYEIVPQTIGTLNIVRREIK